jgi:hypothetical protein
MPCREVTDSDKSLENIIGASSFFRSLETYMNRSGHTRAMEIVFLYDGPRLRASPRHGGQGIFSY